MNPGVVNMYVCGVTVYDLCHLGHARCYLAFDLIHRWLEKSGYDVNYVQNFTDIDDKIIMRCNEKNVDFKEHAREFENSFFADCEALNIRLPTVITRVSEYVPEIVDFIQKIIDNYHRLNHPEVRTKRLQIMDKMDMLSLSLIHI